MRRTHVAHPQRGGEGEREYCRRDATESNSLEQTPDRATLTRTYQCDGNEKFLQVAHTTHPLPHTHRAVLQRVIFAALVTCPRDSPAGDAEWVRALLSRCPSLVFRLAWQSRRSRVCTNIDSRLHAMEPALSPYSLLWHASAEPTTHHMLLPRRG